MTKEKRLKKRHNAEKRFRFYGLASIFLALLFVFFIYLTAMNSMSVVSNVTQQKVLDRADYAPVTLVDDVKYLSDLILKVEDHILFPIGSAELNEASKPLLNELALAVLKSPVKLLIAGHTDPLPISRDIIKSNWHLSALRSASVAHYLQLQGVPKDYLTILGYAETVEYNRLNLNLNRRVEIRLEEL